MAEPNETLRTALADRYVLERELGSGGMATVYLARDLRHDRPVAVKVMRPELAMTLGPDRFLNEIQIAARLSHPHILPVHDSGQSGGFLYYVMPYVEGESLRQRLNREGKLPVGETARILREVADALAYAHERGVVHRDIKPDNVMLSGRHALVADFGVAKAVSEATGRQAITSAGVALGTPSYMAPEQAAADPQVDYRVDLYALGVLGYEMLSGAPPFQYSSLQETLIAQVTRTPVPITDHRPDTPAPLAALVMHCLAKRPGERPTSALELLPTLDAVAVPSGGVTATGAGTAFPSRPVSWVRTGAALVLLLGAGAVALANRTGSGWHPVTLGTQSRITDAPGLETDPAISPDGRFVAYAAGPYFSTHIYVRQVSGGPALDLTQSLPGRHTRPRWSPSSDVLLFITADGQTRRVSEISALGGTPRTLVEYNRDETITSADWSPDGKRLAYDLGGEIYLRTLGDTSSTRLYEGTDPHSLAWSPDGRELVFVEGGSRLWHGASGLANTAPSAILSIPVAGGPVDTIAAQDGINLSPTWGLRGRSLFYISSRDGAKDLYEVPMGRGGRPSGPATRLTTGLNAHTLSMSLDGRWLTFSTLVREANIWMLSLKPGRTIPDDSAVPVTSGNQVIERVSVSSDGRWLLYDSDRSGNAEIYRQRLDQPGAEPERLTTDSANDYAPALSPDGKEIVFHSLRAGNRDLWIMNADGTNQRPLTTGPHNEYAGYWSPDGRSVSFYADSAGLLWLGLISRNAAGIWGSPRLVITGVTGQASWSPDGKMLATSHDGVLSLIDVATGQARPVEPELATSSGLRQALWSADGKSLFCNWREPDGRLTLLQVFLDGRPPVPLVRARDASRAAQRADWTTDGRRYFFTITRYEGDISIVEVKQ